MSKGIFITATGTDIGKTYVTGLIVKLLRQNGLHAGYYKPALSGAERVAGKLVPGDCKSVADRAELAVPPENLVSYIYETAVSPHLASQLEKKPIDPNVILADFTKAKQQYDYLTVEGCGGLVCPLRLDEQRILLTDIIKLLQLDILVIASAGLGTINDVFLTTEYAKRQRIAVKGIILNHYDNNNFLHKDNKKSIELLTGLPVIACVASDAADIRVDLQTLLACYKEV